MVVVMLSAGDGGDERLCGAVVAVYFTLSSCTARALIIEKRVAIENNNSACVPGSPRPAARDRTVTDGPPATVFCSLTAKLALVGAASSRTISSHQTASGNPLASVPWGRVRLLTNHKGEHVEGVR